MEGFQGQRPDEESIVRVEKPVSSLRSLFENKQPPNPTGRLPPVFARPRTTTPLNYEDSTSIASRGSLDLPRLQSPWLEKVETTQHNVISSSHLDRDSFSPAMRRHASMDSVKASQSPPLVTIESPSSPPKPAMQSVPHNLPTTRLSNYSTPSKHGPAPPVPPQRGRNRLPSGNSTTLGMPLKPGTNQSMMPPPTPRTQGQIPSKSLEKPRPPPVNRADKSKALAKVGVGGDSSNLGPRMEIRDSSVSPFSTPPSSDEENVNRNLKGSGHHRQRSSLKEGTLYHASNEHGHIFQNQPVNTNEALSRPKKMKDARELGFSPKVPGHGDLPDDRPQLPPRVEPGLTKTSRAAQGSVSAPRLPTRTPTAHQRIPSLDPASRQRMSPPPTRLQDAQRGRPDTASSLRPSPAQSTRPASRQEDYGASDSHTDGEISGSSFAEYPDASNANRRPPQLSSGLKGFDTDYDARLVSLSGQYACTTGHSTRVWDLESGRTVANLYHGEREVKITAVSFKACVRPEDEGKSIWLGTNYGDLQEVDIAAQSVVASRSGTHEKRDVTAIHRHQTSMWTLDDSGRLNVWSGTSSGSPNLHGEPFALRVARGQMVTLVIQDKLWVATGKEIRVYRPSTTDSSGFVVLQNPLSQPSIGTVTAATIIDNQKDRVYFGHSDGKVSVYSTANFECLNVVNVSAYKVVSLAGVGALLWAGYNTGMIYVYDTQEKPWVTKKEWQAHQNSPVLDVVVDRSSLWKAGELRVASVGSDSAIRIWDGTLQDDWKDEDMRDHDIEFCSFREVTATVVTWNAGAATPTHLRHDGSDSQVFPSILQSHQSSDLLVFGFQELVDLEDKRLTAKSLFKGTKKKDPLEQEHMSRQYRAWRDYLVRCVEDNMPTDESYQLVHTSNMVGLFSCVFIKSAIRHCVRGIEAAEIKRGMGGLHGNKGALIVRFNIDDSSICLVNCHLAAGQSQTVNRNNDIAAILDSAVLPPERNQMTRRDTYVCGGDGSMIIDNEVTILNGDLNYRIDTMGRDVVVKAIAAKNYTKLLERDQLLVSRRRNPGFRLLAFKELPLTFGPTYKYDVGTDTYDTSEKRRVPAWCDRILYRGTGKIKQLDYRRHELRVSDHRPVSGLFRIRIKQISADKREQVWARSDERFLKAKEQLTADAQVTYLRDVLGVPPEEAARLV